MTVQVLDIPSQIEYWTEQRKKVFLDRYAAKGPDSEPTEQYPEQMWDRVAEAIGDTADERFEFRRILDDFKFVPGGRILSGAGIDAEVTAYNCFVIPLRNEHKPEAGNDSREAIFDTRNRMVNIMSRGGGVGINWSTLRPNGSYLKRVNGTTSGPVAWMNAASVDVGTVMQGGSRRGAAMFMLWDWHPDVEEFINHKRDETKTKNANISVAISEAFMEAVKNDDDWELRFPDTSDPKYNSDWDGDLAAWVDAGRPVVVYKTLKARELWNEIAKAAHASGEPGVVFLERYNLLSTGKDEEKIICVNPCGEQGLGANSVCNLGSMNLDKYMIPGVRYRNADGTVDRAPYAFDEDSFALDVKTAIRFLDNVIDKAYYTDFPETKEQQMKLRRMGLGTMGLADALIKMEIPYGSKEAIDFTEKVWKTMRYSAIDASVDLAEEKGAAPGWTPNKAARPFFQGIPSETFSRLQKHGIRNLFLLTQAPTGTTSLLAGVNSGIEPYFAFELTRKDRTNADGWDFIAPPFREYLLRGGDPEELPEWFVTTNDLTPEEHIDMMAAAQAHCDSSISKTVNAPNHATLDGVLAAYNRAYEAGLKAVAYYRDGSRGEQVLNHKKEETLEDKIEVTNGISFSVEQTKFRRPTKLHATVSKHPTALGTAYLTISRDTDGKPRELFVNIGKAGSDVQQLAEAVARLVSTALQHDVDPHAIKAQLNGIGGYGKMRKSLPTAIADAIDEALVEDEFPEPELDEGYVNTDGLDEGSINIGSLCPNCQEFSVIHTNGCMECMLGCGYTAC